MNEQLHLFSSVQTKPIALSEPTRPLLPVTEPPLCHNSDPLTSYEAADALQKSGKLAAQQQAVLDALREHDGSTHGELGEAMGVHWLTPARRLPELERAKLVKKGEPRICRVKGSRCSTWWIGEAGQ